MLQELTPVLLGRRSECAALDELLTQAQSGTSSVLVVRGEPGVGKSALLAYLADRAETWHVVRAAGVEAEIELSYAGLHQLVAPFLNHADALPTPQAEALRTAFGLRQGPPPNRFMVGLAVLTLLTNAAEKVPLVWIVDDAQWLDQASMHTLSFVARRLLAETVVVVFASRQTTADDDLRTFAALHVRGLKNAEAGALLDSVVPGPLERRVRSRLLNEAGGNPLALLELPRGLGVGELAFGYTDAATMPLVTRIEDGFLRRLQPLPVETKLLMLVAALQPEEDASVVWRTADRLSIDVQGAAVPAIECGLLKTGSAGNSGVQFRHPLVRSAVYRDAAQADVRTVHAALAEVTDPTMDRDRRAWHRAQSVATPDDAIASELEECATQAQARGGLPAAATLLERSVALTADPALRARRALAAAGAKHQAGALDEALALLAIAEGGPLEPLDRALVHLVRAQVAFFSHHGGDAPELLLTAARELEPLDADLARQTYLDALTAAMFAGRLSGSVGLQEVAAAARDAPRPTTPEGPSDLLLDGLSQLIVEGYAAGTPILQDAVRAFRATDMPAMESLRWLWLATHAAHDLWDDASWADLCDRHVRLARKMGALHVLPIALSARMGLHLFAGELSTVAVLVHEARTVTQATGSSLPPYGEIALAAWQGREAEVVRLVDAVSEEVHDRGDGLGLTLIRHAQAVMYNSLGRYPEALNAATEGAAHPQELAFATWSLAELVEAAVRSGVPDRAAPALAQLVEIADASRTDWARGVVARCRALVAQDAAYAEGQYVEAIAYLGRTKVPLALARAHLVYGEWLRREGRRVDARVQLRAAFALFQEMGVDGFTERARRELAATGETARRTAATGLADGLSAQETQIARLAVEGMTNAEIGMSLFISARTVEWHLRKVYMKLGVTSRKNLAPALPNNGRAKLPA